MHAVVPAAPERGLPPGAIFALRNRNDGVNINQQNRLHPYYLVYIAQDGQILVNHTEVEAPAGSRPRRLQGTGRARSARPISLQQGDQGRPGHGAYSALLDQAIRSMIEIKEEKDIDSLFTGGKTSALLNTIPGLEDFELIAFIVVQASISQ